MLEFPLYHGTSTIFLESIKKHGLGGWISFADTGEILLSPQLPSHVVNSLLGQGCNECSISQFTPRHFTYLAWHREKVYRKS